MLRDNGDFSAQPSVIRTLEAMQAWVELRIENNYHTTADTRGHSWLGNWSAEVSHSPTLSRIMNAQPIYTLRPPLMMSYPAHSLLDTGWSWFKAKPAEMNVLPGVPLKDEHSYFPNAPHLCLHNTVYVVDEQPGPEEWLVSFWPQTEWKFRITRYPEIDNKYCLPGYVSDFVGWKLEVLTERELHPKFEALYASWRKRGLLTEKELSRAQDQHVLQLWED